MATTSSEVQVNLSKQEAPFEQINIINTRSFRTNSLFNLIEILKDANDPLIQEYDLNSPQNKIDNKKRIAYIFKFKIVPQVVLYQDEGYHFIESHLTVDKFFSKSDAIENKKGLTAAHYTENYEHPQLKTKITVRVYLTVSGQYYIQVKKTMASGVTSELLITPLLANNIKNNAHDAITIFQELIKEKSKRYLEAIENANAYEKQLNLLSQNFSFEQNRNEYRQVASNFQAQIKLINLYNDEELDVRDEIIYNMITKLENFEIPTLAVSTLAEPTEENQIPVIIQKRDEKKLREEAKNKLFKEIEDLYNVLRAHETYTIKNIITAHQQANQLRDKLLELLFSQELTIAEQKKYQDLNSIIEGTINAIPPINEFFINAALEGNLENFKLLFPFVTKAEQISISGKMLAHLSSQDSGNATQLAGKIAICDFLFENSEAYRACIIIRDSMLRNNSRLDMAASFLYEVFLKDKVSVFEMLLKHGFYPNGPGLLFKDKMIPILRCILSMENNIEYIKLLLQYGASINLPKKTLKTLAPESFVKLSSIKESTSTDISKFSQGNYTLDTKTILLESPSDLWLACKYGAYACVPYLLERSNLFDITLAFAAVTILKEYRTLTLYKAAVPGIYCYATEKESKEVILAEQAGAVNINTQDQIKIMLCPLRNITEAFSSIQKLCQTFKERYEKEPKDIEIAINKLKDYTNNEYSKNPEAIKSIDFYNAYIFLICEKKGKLTFLNTIKLIELYTKIGNFFLTGSDPNIELAKENFQTALTFVNHSAFAEYLKKQDIYKFAERKLEKIANNNNPTPMLSRYATQNIGHSQQQTDNKLPRSSKKNEKLKK